MTQEDTQIRNHFSIALPFLQTTLNKLDSYSGKKIPNLRNNS